MGNALNREYKASSDGDSGAGSVGKGKGKATSAVLAVAPHGAVHRFANIDKNRYLK